MHFDKTFQDTVVALQALSDFAAMAYSDTFDIQATVTADTFIHTFTINKQNALVLQSVVVRSLKDLIDVFIAKYFTVCFN